MKRLELANRKGSIMESRKARTRVDEKSRGMPWRKKNV